MSYRKFSLLLLSIFAAFGLGAQNLSREQYIEKYKDVAIHQMHKHKIPASIILAQACLESSDGNSSLARKANNHFGIKCHDGWKSKKFRQDDDERNECFRKYEKAVDSFTDHSNFLCSRTRYASLFDLPITDYKAWAHGLKAAGYATNPKYAQLLINIIEEYQLYKYDSKKVPPHMQKKTFAQRKEERLLKRKEKYERKADKAAKKAQKASDKYYKHVGIVPPQEAPIKVSPEPVKPHNGGNSKGDYTVKQGDTLYSIGRKHGISVSDIQRLNPGIKANELKVGTRLKLK